MMGRWAVTADKRQGRWSWFVFHPCRVGCASAHRIPFASTPRYSTWDEAIEHVRRELEK